jgi:hypothetical protein
MRSPTPRAEKIEVKANMEPTGGKKEKKTS